MKLMSGQEAALLHQEKMEERRAIEAASVDMQEVEKALNKAISALVEGVHDSIHVVSSRGDYQPHYASHTGAVWVPRPVLNEVFLDLSRKRFALGSWNLDDLRSKDAGFVISLPPVLADK